MKIITNLSVYDKDRNPEDEEYGIRLVDEQNYILDSLGYYMDICYVIKADNKHLIYTDIDDAIQMLALKEGADLVQFDSGNIGYVGYYGNTKYDKHNCFEILGTAQRFQEKYGKYLSWKEAERRVGYNLDWNNALDNAIYLEELMSVVEEKFIQ